MFHVLPIRTFFVPVDSSYLHFMKSLALLCYHELHLFKNINLSDETFDPNAVCVSGALEMSWGQTFSASEN